MKDNMMLILLISVCVIAWIIAVLYCRTLYKFMQKMPRGNHFFPSWFVWLTLIPLVGIIFQVMMMPLGIPKTIQKTYPNNPNTDCIAHSLCKLGWAQVIAGILQLIPLELLRIIGMVVGLISLIQYWRKIAKFNA